MNVEKWCFLAYFVKVPVDNSKVHAEFVQK
jgi:hypothetical protein